MESWEEVSRGLFVARVAMPLNSLMKIDEAFDEVAFDVEREIAIVFGLAVSTSAG